MLNNLDFSVPVVLVGNKTDLHQERAVSTEEGKRIAESWKAIFLECSAKQNEVCFIIFSMQKLPVYSHYFSFIQSVAEIFHSLIMLIEKENGNQPANKSNCSIS